MELKEPPTIDSVRGRNLSDSLTRDEGCRVELNILLIRQIVEQKWRKDPVWDVSLRRKESVHHECRSGDTRNKWGTKFHFRHTHHVPEFVYYIFERE